eukprot:80434-Chlamydomonas_euryale.AAC.1
MPGAAPVDRSCRWLSTWHALFKAVVTASSALWLAVDVACCLGTTPTAFLTLPLSVDMTCCKRYTQQRLPPRLQGNTLTTGWVGDSRGVIGRETQENGWEAIELTEDHKPANPEEQARIIASNGRVERCGGRPPVTARAALGRGGVSHCSSQRDQSLRRRQVLCHAS